MLLTEFNEKKFAQTMWEEGHESGYNEGHKSGYSEGRESGYSEGHESGYNEGRKSGYKKAHDDIFKIMDEINKGNETLDKLISLGYDEELVKHVLEKKQYIDKQVMQCYKERGCALWCTAFIIGFVIAFIASQAI